MPIKFKQMLKLSSNYKDNIRENMINKLEQEPANTATTRSKDNSSKVQSNNEKQHKYEEKRSNNSNSNQEGATTT